MSGDLHIAVLILLEVEMQTGPKTTELAGYYLWVEFSRREQHSTRRADTEQREHDGSPHSH